MSKRETCTPRPTHLRQPRPGGRRVPGWCQVACTAQMAHFCPHPASKPNRQRVLRSIQEKAPRFARSFKLSGINSHDDCLRSLQVASQSLQAISGMFCSLLPATAQEATCLRLKPDGSQTRKRPRVCSDVERICTRTTRMSVPRLGT